MTISNPWPPYHLLEVTTQSGRPAVAEIPRVLAGNAALYRGHTVGGALVDGATNLSPYGGHGKGHDHSGGEMGEPLFHTLASAALNDGFTPSGGLLWTLGGILLWTTPQIGPSTDGAVVRYSEPVIPLYVPPCQSSGAYHELSLRFSAQLSAGAGVILSGDNFQLWWRNLSAPPGDGSVVTWTLTGPEGYKSARLDGLVCIPGQINLIVLDSVQYRTAAGGTTRRPNLSIYDVSLGIPP
jgi:hypothetical protein